MEKDLWIQLSQKMVELEEDREKMFHLKSEMDKLKNKNSKGVLDQQIITIHIFILLGGLLDWGLWGVIINALCVSLPLMIAEGVCREWWGKRNYLNKAPMLQEQLEKIDEQCKEKYTKEDWDHFETLITKKLFSDEAVKYISELIMQQQDYDMALAIDIYCNSNHYRPNLVKKNSEKNSTFLKMIWEEK